MFVQDGIAEVMCMNGGRASVSASVCVSVSVRIKVKVRAFTRTECLCARRHCGGSPALELGLVLG